MNEYITIEQWKKLLEIEKIESPYQAIPLLRKEIVGELVEKELLRKFKLTNETVEQYCDAFINYNMSHVEMFEVDGQMEMFILLQRSVGNNKLIQEVVDKFAYEGSKFNAILEKHCQNEILTKNIKQLTSMMSALTTKIENIEEKLSQCETRIGNQENKTTEDITKLTKDVKEGKERIDDVVASCKELKRQMEIVKSKSTEKINHCYEDDDKQSYQHDFNGSATTGQTQDHFNPLINFNHKTDPNEQPKRLPLLGTPSDDHGDSNESNGSIQSIPQFQLNGKQYVGNTDQHIFNQNTSGNGSRPIYGMKTMYPQESRQTQSQPSPSTVQPMSYVDYNSVPVYQKSSTRQLKFDCMPLQLSKVTKPNAIIDSYLGNMVKLAGMKQGASIIDMKGQNTFTNIFNAIQGCQHFILLFFLNTGEVFGSYHSAHPTHLGESVVDDKHFVFSLANGFNEQMERYTWKKHDEPALQISEDELIVSRLAQFQAKKCGFIFSENYPFSLHYSNSTIRGRQIFSSTVFPKKFTWKELVVIRLV